MHRDRMEFTTDDLERAADAGLIDRETVRRLTEWQAARNRRDDPHGLAASAPSSPHEQKKGFNLVTVAYYFGAMLMISACAWFLGDKWNELGSGGVLATTLIYGVVCLGLGLWLRDKGYLVGG